ncbi:hypothetical protein KM043_017846 [Ampulex compressa]|nr:hypothetical protein KM043_017846 [Ampulex compressa]
MGLMGTLCVGSAEKRAGSIRGTGGPRVLSHLWWGVLPDDRGIRSSLGEGAQGRGLTTGPSPLRSSSSFFRTSFHYAPDSDIEAHGVDKATARFSVSYCYEISGINVPFLRSSSSSGTSFSKLTEFWGSLVGYTRGI